MTAATTEAEMRLLSGSKVVEAAPGWRESLPAGRPLIIDLGTGDGRFPYERARHDPESFYIGVDAEATLMAAYAYRATRKPARGGVENVRFVVAAMEQLPPELGGLAGLVRVNFPWGGLLRGLLRPEPATLAALAGLAAPQARFEIVLCYDPERDNAALAGLAALPAPDERYVDATLTPAYAESGILLDERRRLTQDEALAIPSSWGRRLLHGRPRDVLFFGGRLAPHDERQ